MGVGVRQPSPLLVTCHLRAWGSRMLEEWEPALV